MLKLNLNLKELSKIVKGEKASQFLIELPDGLKIHSRKVITELEKTGKKFVLSINTTFGACDIYETELKKANCQAIIHFGHTKFVLNKIKEKIIYWPCFYDFDEKDIEKIAKNIENKFFNETITIVGPIQYKNIILEVIKKLKKNQKVKVMMGKNLGRLECTQILGCDISSIKEVVKKIDSVIYIGDGNFHFNALKNLKVKGYKYLFNGKFEKILNPKKPTLDAIFLESKNIGIYVSSKIGQNQIKVAENIAQKIRQIKKNSIILFGNEINNDKLYGLNLDLLINTACPRITDDYKNYNIPIINYNNLMGIYKRYYK